MSQIRGKIVRIFSNTVLAVNVGSKAGVTKGTRFTIHSEPIDVQDIDGTSLGPVWFHKGRVVATGVFENFSIVETEKLASFLGLGMPPLQWPQTTQHRLTVRESDLDPAQDPDVVRVGDVVVSVEEPKKAAQATGGDTQEPHEQEAGT